jgi:hypothetical protein
MVKWNDAFSPAATEVVEGCQASRLNQDLHILTVGWLLNDDLQRGLVIAGEWCGEDSYRGCTVVPRAMVVEVTPVGAKPVRRREPRAAGGKRLEAAFMPDPPPTHTPRTGA